MDAAPLALALVAGPPRDGLPMPAVGIGAGAGILQEARPKRTAGRPSIAASAEAEARKEINSGIAKTTGGISSSPASSPYP